MNAPQVRPKSTADKRTVYGGIANNVRLQKTEQNRVTEKSTS